MWALVKDNKVVKYPYTRKDLKADNPLTSFPIEIGKTTLAFYDVEEVRVDFTVPEHDIAKETTEQETWPTRTSDGLVVRQKVVPKPGVDKEALENKARAQRDKLLSESDWLIVFYLEKNGEVPEEVSSYREALRDLPKQEGFPSEVEWPEKPNGL